MMQFDLTINVIVTDDACTAEIINQMTGEELATGSSKRHPNDTPDDVVGVNLATARAFQALAEMMIDHASCGLHLE